MRRLAFFVIAAGIFATTITGIYLPPEGRKPEGVKLSLGKVSFKTEKGGFFFVSGVKEGAYSLMVEGRNFGTLRVKGDFLILWVDGVEETFYITRNFPESPGAELEKDAPSLEEALFLSPDLSFYRGTLFFQALSRTEYMLSSASSLSGAIPYPAVERAEVSVGYPRARVRIWERPALSPGFRLTTFLMGTSREDRAESYSMSPYLEGEVGYRKGGFGGFFSGLLENRDFALPEEQSVRKHSFYLSLFAGGVRGFFLSRGEDYENLRERPYYSPSSSWNGQVRERGFGGSLNAGGFSLTVAEFSRKRNLDPVSPSPYFLFDDVNLIKDGGNYREDLKEELFSLNSSMTFHSSSFLGLNNIFAVGVEVLSREVQGERDWPLELVSFAGEAGFAYLRTSDAFHYRLNTAGVWLSDTIAAGNVNLFFSTGYDLQWFKVYPSSSRNSEIFGLSLEGTSVPSFSSKIIGILGLRGGLSYDPFRNGFLVIRIYGSYRGIPLPESLLYRASSALSYEKFLWNDDGDMLPQEGEFTSLYRYTAQASQKDISLYPPGLGASRFYRIGAGVSSDLPLGLSVDLDLFYIKNTLPYVDIPLVWKDEEWKLVSWGDWEEGGNFPMEFGGQKWFGLREGVFFNGYYQTLNLISVERSWKEMRFRLKKSGTLSFLFQFNLRSNYFTINQNLYPLDPGNLNFLLSRSWGPSPNGFYHSPILNSRWSVLFNMAWSGGGWTLGGVFRARDGYMIPVNYVDTETLRPGLYDHPRGLAAPLGEFKLPTWWRVDAYLQREFSLGGFRAAVFLRALNLFNTRIPAEEWENVLQPEFLSPRWYYPPRQVILGLRITK